MKYRKVPVVIEAMEWTGDNGEEVIKWVHEVAPELREPLFRFEAWPETDETKGMYSLYIHTLEGEMQADIGDMIICGIKGEFYPCKPDIFAKTYEVVV